MKQMHILNPGIHSLLQDSGRFGQHGLGLTTGGPLDPEAFCWANRLCGNPDNCTAIEITLGGLELVSSVATTLALAGANMPLRINDQLCETWCSHRIESGDRISIGYSSSGCRAYLAIKGGFQVPTQFGSTATVVREKIGGLNGLPLQKGDTLQCLVSEPQPQRRLPESQRPHYGENTTLRLIPGYQFQQFSDRARDRFFNSDFLITPQSNRMGYRLSGPPIVSGIESMLSEGITLGAVQIPGDGQPIILLNDRQTIGGYPKLGSILSTDLGKLAQLQAGNKVSFQLISAEEGLQIVRQERTRWEQFPLEIIE